MRVIAEFKEVKTSAELSSQYQQHGYTNVLFEAGMRSLSDDLERILTVLESARVPFEIVGGVAVLAHILAAQKGRRSFLTKDIDLLISRTDFPDLLRVAGQEGYRAQRIMGGYALVLPNQELIEAVHIIFVGEKARARYPVTNPELNPEIKNLFGLSVPVGPLKDLLILKLNSLRTRDKLHIEVLDKSGLVTPAIEQELPSELQARLEQVRREYEEDLISDA